jgi:C-terminal processing protease CtpA/Prc
VGDILERVDDVDASVLSNEELAKLMLGPPGTLIVCSFRRKEKG